MIVFENSQVCLIPLYYNAVFSTSDKMFTLKTISIELINEVVEMVKTKGSIKTYIVDMQFMDILPAMESQPLAQLALLHEEFQIALINIQSNMNILPIIEDQFKVEGKVYYDIRTLKKLPIDQIDTTRDWSAFVVGKNAIKLVENFEMFLFVTRKLYSESVIRRITENCIDDNIQYLPSSDIYSNRYIKIKELFKCNEELNVSIYLLCKLIKDHFFRIQFDAIVSMSNTGAVLANLIGKTIDKKVVFCTNVGPQFALDVSGISNHVVAGRKYLYVFDFMCLGTEIKNLKAILACFNATVVGGVGIASYINLEKLRENGDKTQESKSSLIRAYSIFTLDEAGIDYRIGIDKDILR